MATAFRLREYLLPTAASAIMILYCVVISPKRWYWNDELFSWFMLADPSFSHMMEAFHDQLNNTPGFYFITGWIWAQLFGAEELSLRLFSCLGFCAAFWLIWLLLRRHFGFWPASIGALSVFMTSQLILSQIPEARMYGLFTALSAAGLFVYDWSGRAPESKKWRFAMLTFLIHGALIHTHLFGMFYSGALLAATLLRDSLRKKPHLLLYGSIVAAWLTFFLYYPAFVVQADVGSPRGWLPYPNHINLNAILLNSKAAFVRPYIISLLIGWLILRYSLSGATSTANGRPPLHRNPGIDLLIPAFLFLLVPLGVWILSFLIRPIFWDRYMIPTALAICTAVAFLVAHIMLPNKHTGEQSALNEQYRRLFYRANNLWLPASLSVLLLIIPLWKSTKSSHIYHSEHLLEVAENYPELPIVVQHSNWFQEILYYAPEHSRSRYHFILDKEAACQEGSGAYDLQEFKHMSAFRRQYPDYYEGQVIESEDFLKAHDRFLVIDYPHYNKTCPWKTQMGADTPYSWWEETHCPQWLEYRILDNPHYRVTVLENKLNSPSHSNPITNNQHAVLLVEKAPQTLRSNKK